MGEIDLSGWQWIQANSWWIGRIVVAWLCTLIAAVLWLFWRNREPKPPKCPPLDQALMELPDDFAAGWIQRTPPAGGDATPAALPREPVR